MNPYFILLIGALIVYLLVTGRMKKVVSGVAG